MPAPASASVAPIWRYNDRPANTPYVVQRVSRMGAGYAYDVWCSDTHTERTLSRPTFSPARPPQNKLNNSLAQICPA